MAIVPKERTSRQGNETLPTNRHQVKSKIVKCYNFNVDYYLPKSWLNYSFIEC